MSERGPRVVALQEGRRLLDAWRHEERTTGPHDPHPAYVEWLVWARNNAETMLEALEYVADAFPLLRRD